MCLDVLVRQRKQVRSVHIASVADWCSLYINFKGSGRVTDEG